MTDVASMADNGNFFVAALKRRLQGTLRLACAAEVPSSFYGSPAVHEVEVLRSSPP